MKEKELKVTLFADRVLIEPIVEEKTAGGIIIPDSAQKQIQPKGKVVVVGPGRSLDQSVAGATVTGVMPMSVKVGDVVFFSMNSGNAVLIEGKTYLIMRENELYGILK